MKNFRNNFQTVVCRSLMPAIISGVALGREDRIKPSFDFGTPDMCSQFNPTSRLRRCQTTTVARQR